MKKQDFDKLNKHLGYGSNEPEYIIMGLEEGLDINSIQKNYLYRFNMTNQNGLIDLNSFHSTAPLVSLNQWFIPKIKMQSTWRWYCKLFLHHSKTPISTQSLLYYQKTMLGRTNSNHAIVEFYPLPRANHNHWDNLLMPVNNLFHDIASYKSFCASKNINRINQLMNLINNPKCKSVVVHGSLKKNGQIKQNYNLFLSFFSLNHSICKTHVLDKNILAAEYNYNNKVKIFFIPFLGQGHFSDIAVKNLSILI